MEDAWVGLSGRAGRSLLAAHQQRIEEAFRAAARQLAPLQVRLLLRGPYPYPGIAALQRASLSRCRWEAFEELVVT